MIDPETADSGIRVRQRKPVIKQRVRVEGRGDVHADPLLPRPVEPAGELPDRERIAVDSREGAVDLVPLQADPVFPRNQRESDIEVASQLFGVPGAAG